jgi:7-cyano-7-deazaguanine synthase
MFEEVHAITFDYGQTHIREIRAAEEVTAMAKVKTWSLIHTAELISKSPLVDSSQSLERYENAEQMEKTIGDRRELTFVPMRNALFLTIAANRAEAWGISSIVIGVCQMDNANYDDCRYEFIRRTQDYINAALGHDHRGTRPIRIHTPLMDLSKADTVRMAKGLPGCWEALAYTHTSYDGKYPPTDMNHANVLRADGFEKAGLPDPLVVRAWSEGLMELPKTTNYDECRK